MSKVSQWLATVAFIGLAATPAFANDSEVAATLTDSGGSTEGGTEQFESSTEYAVAGTATQATGSEEIFVTARRFAERAQDTPISLTALTEGRLEDATITTLTDIARVAPSVSFQTAALGPSSTYIAMRGVVVNDTRLTVDPTIGVYIDGVYIPRLVGIDASDLFDLSRLEVLSGPQGTLFGKNTTGGALNISTNRPSDEFEGSVRLRAADHGTMSAAGMLNIPIADDMGLRLVGQWNYREGYGRNLASPGDRFGHVNTHQFRGTFDFKPSDDITVVLRGNYTHGRVSSTGYGAGDIMVLGSTANREVMAETGLSPEEARDLYLSWQPNGSSARGFDGLGNNVHPEDVFTTWGVSGTVDWEFADGITLRSITAYTGLERSGQVDLDGSPFQIIEFLGLRVDQNQFSQEFQLLGSAIDNRLRYVFGFYYADEDGTERTGQRSAGFLSAANGQTIQEGIVENRTVAAFGEATFELTDGFEVTGGLRYSKDWRNLTSFNRNNVFCLALGVPFADLAGPCERVVDEITFDAWSYRLGASYRPTQDIMLYARFDHGYRTGGLPLTGGSAVSPEAATGSYLPFEPEYVDAYEIGIKSEWFDRRLRANLALFRSEYSDLQRNVSQPLPGTTTLLNVVLNIASTTIQGVDLEVVARPLTGLDIGGNLTYLDAEYNEFTTPQGVDLSFLPVLETPEWSWTVYAGYEIPTSFGHVRPQIDYFRQSSVLTSQLTGFKPRVEQVNARLNFNIERANLDVALFVRNLLDDRTFTFPLDFSVPGSLGIRTLGPVNTPRTIGVEVIGRF